MVVAALAKDPQEWRPLAKIYRQVADAIPMHLAMRRAATLERQNRQRRGDDTEVKSTDLDILKAQWLMFTSFVRPLVERQGGKGQHVQRTELVRLKPVDKPCAACGGPVYLTAYNGKRKHGYSCPRCAHLTLVKPVKPPQPVVTTMTKPPVLTLVEPPGPDIIEWVELPPLPAVDPRVIDLVNGWRQYAVTRVTAQVKPLPPPSAPKLRMILPTQATTPVKPKPQPQPAAVKKPTNRPPTLGQHPIEEAWLFVLVNLENNQRNNTKLHRSLRLAFDLGMVNEYAQIIKWGNAELALLGPTEEQAISVVKHRAVKWVNLELGYGNNKLLPPDLKRRRQWLPRIVNAYSIASLCVADLAVKGRLPEIDDTYHKLCKKRGVKPEEPKSETMIQRFIKRLWR
jgi:DNA-directed RNA polymerase subunit RPC12/RpoP